MTVMSNMASMICKIRAVKSYPEAQNHILIGEVRRADNVAVEIHCRTFHYGKAVNKTDDIRGSAPDVRIIPWSRIEIVRILPEHFDYANATLQSDGEGNIALCDDQHACSIITTRAPRY